MNRRIWLDHAWRNRLQSLLLVVALLAIAATAGKLLLGELGPWLVLGACAFALLAEPAAGAALTLRMAGAQPLAPRAAPQLWQLVEAVAGRAGLPTAPALHYIPSRALNAFAVGSANAPAIAVTDGLLRQLTPRELAAVLAHETAHIANGDLRVMRLAAQVGQVTAVLSLAGQLLLLVSLPSLMTGNWWRVDWLGVALLVFSPQIALLAQLGLSRIREFDADLKAAALTGDPQGLARALANIEEQSRPWLARWLPGLDRRQTPWLASHPATDQRIARLQSLTGRPFSVHRWAH